MDVQRSYSGYLAIGEIPPQDRDRLNDLVRESQILDAYANGMEVSYSGRDSSRFVVRTLQRLARLVRDASGEIRCEVSGDVDQPAFEFYQIHGGRLYRQSAEIVRDSPQDVTDEL